jgi:outer membrane protein, heavy metal efflux system
MSTVIGWRSFVKIRVSIIIGGFACAIAASSYMADEAWAQSGPGSPPARAPSGPAPAATGAPPSTSAPSSTAGQPGQPGTAGPSATGAPPATGATPATAGQPADPSAASETQLPGSLPASERLALSLPDAVRRAMEQSPEVVNAERNIRTAEARRVGAGVIMPMNPRVSVDARPPVYGGGGYRDTGYGAMIDFLFDAGGAPAARIREADREATVARADFVFDRAAARLRAFTAYVHTQIAELRIAEIRSAMEISRRVVVAAQRRLATGAASELEATQAELDFALLQAAEAAFIRERDQRLMDLRDVLDLSPTVALDLTSPVDEPPRLSDAQVYVDRALRRHPALAALQARVHLLDATEVRLEREIFPRVGVYAGVDAAPLSPVYGLLGLSLELPFAQRNQGPRAVTARQREGVRTRIELEARRLSRDVVAAWNAYEARRLELERITQRAMPAAAKTLSFAEAGWQAGRFDLFRLLTAARDALRLRANRIDVLEAAWLARIELERAVGEEISS